MKIAKVIVDVPLLSINKPFDYLIPEQWIDFIQPGMRVIVPFGPRKLQGIVEEISDYTEVAGLKAIEEPMDVEPVLNEELLHLGQVLAETTLALKITAYQVMLPPALKAKYEKYIVIGKNKRVDELPSELQKMFQQKDRVHWKDAEQFVNSTILYREARKGTIDVIYEVKNRGEKKKIAYYAPSVNNIQLQEAANETRSEKQKEIIQYFLENPKPETREELEKQLGEIYSQLQQLLKKGVLRRFYQEQYRDPYEDYEFKKTEPLPLTEDQKKAIGPILHSIENKNHEVFLLHGVTGSGKTEIYLQAIDEVIKKGKEAIVLVPEISLTPQMVNRFKGRFGNKVAVLHSGLSLGEKYDEWRKIQRREVQVAVGARSAIFAPFRNLGIIIIDEEHETSYKQEDNPRYHARDVAIERGKYHQCPVVLGSATPSLESYARAKKGVYSLLSMPHRMNPLGLPQVEIVDMREELRAGNRSMFSRVLLEKMKERIERKEQIVLFLNRRGYSSFIMCRDCGHVVRCPNCDISMTYHKFSNQLKCHYCGFEEIAPSLCPECGRDHIRYFGTGTQRVEEELGKILPEARVIRMDVDTTSRKGAHERLLADFRDQKADILLGTQMIAKGLDFPNITLVGVLSADTLLHIPDFRSSEKTFQLLTQVTGRAGRSNLPGESIIQTYTPEHYSIQLAKEQDYLKFFQYEMLARKRGQYPPYYYLALIQISHENLLKVTSAAEKIAAFLRSELGSNTIILGPSSSPIPRLNNKYRYQCIVKYKREPKLYDALEAVLNHFNDPQGHKGLTVTIDVNPFSMM